MFTAAVYRQRPGDVRPYYVGEAGSIDALCPAARSVVLADIAAGRWEYWLGLDCYTVERVWPVVGAGAVSGGRQV